MTDFNKRNSPHLLLVSFACSDAQGALSREKSRPRGKRQSLMVTTVNRQGRRGVGESK
jgi:hypothetical protein